MTRWIIEKCQGFTDVGLYRISESLRAYAYLILSSQAAARSNIIGITVNALTTQKDFLNNFENVVNCRVNIREDIKRNQDLLCYPSSATHKALAQKPTITHEEEKMALILFLTGAFTLWYMFQ